MPTRRGKAHAVAGPSAATLFLASKIGLSSFGDGLSGWMLREFVQARAWLDEEEFLNGLALAQAPGVDAVNLAIWVGYRLRGTWGVLGIMVLPAVVAVAVAAGFALLLRFAVAHLVLDCVGDRPVADDGADRQAPGLPRRCAHGDHGSGVRRRGPVRPAAAGARATASQRRHRVPAAAAMVSGIGLALLRVFAPLSLVSVGGGQAVVASIHHQAVEQHHWLTEAQFAWTRSRSRG